MLIFKQLENAILSVNENISSLKKNSEQAVELVQYEIKKLECLTLILKYARSYKWIKHTALKHRVNIFLKNNYDYNKSCIELGISKTNLEKSISYANKVLKNKIGTNTIKMILAGNLYEGILNFRRSTNSINIYNLFPDNIVSLLPHSTSSPLPYKLSECIQEIEFIYSLTRANILKEINSKDKDKLAYLVYLLSTNDSLYLSEQSLIFKLMLGNINLEQFKSIIHSKNKNIYSD